jgi:hypothetical protein
MNTPPIFKNAAALLKLLPKEQLLDLAVGNGITGLTGKPKDDVVKTLAENPGLRYDVMLNQLSRDDLKKFCTVAAFENAGDCAVSA